MNKQVVYDLLEEKQLTFTDYETVVSKDNGEKMIVILSREGLCAKQMDPGMTPYTGAEVYVRKGVLDRLRVAASILVQHDPTLALQVVYGYRALEIQKRLFDENIPRFAEQCSGRELMGKVHKLVAVPWVAGHPAGAAVDIRIMKNGAPMEFGTEVWEFVPDSFTFSPFVSKEAWNNRQLLRRVMMQAGFAPFDGEWWHFSYGDKEWAKYYAQPTALYEQIDFRSRAMGEDTYSL